MSRHAGGYSADLVQSAIVPIMIQSISRRVIAIAASVRRRILAVGTSENEYVNQGLALLVLFLLACIFGTCALIIATK